MFSKYLLRRFFLLQLAINVLAINEYIYEFGNKDIGRDIHTTNGVIHLLQYNTYINIPVPPNTDLSYVSVRVNAINPPKVDFDNERRTLSIKYSILELPISSYSIFVKGVP